MKAKLIILFVVAVVLATVLIRREPSDSRCKRFVLGHLDEWQKVGEVYKINHTNMKYYTDVTIKPLDTDSYYLIFWGDRDSWLWNFRLDKAISVDVPYRKSKHWDTTLDSLIVYALNYKTYGR